MTSVVKSPLLLQGNRVKKAIVVLLSLFFVACEQAPAPHLQLSGATMGTTWHITVLEQEGIDTSAEQLQQAIDEQLRLINQQMSTYIDDSELSRLNRAPAEQPVAVSNNLFDVLLLSLEVGWLTDGAFDITVGPLVDVWGFGPGEHRLNESVPDPQQIDALRENTGFTRLEFDLASSSVIRHGALKLDLSGVAKGYAVDKVAELLNFAGYENYMVEIGGELRLRGSSPRGTPWRIAVEEPDPQGLHSVHRVLELTDIAMATSGDYRNYFERDGKRYSHTIDPTTGYPITHNLASVTVLSESAAYADAVATGLDVLGPEKGMKLAQNQGLAVYMIIKGDQGFESVSSAAFEALTRAP